MLKLVKKFRKEEEGASLIEYSLLVGLISVAVAATIVLLKGNLVTIWSTLQSIMAGAAG